MASSERTHRVEIILTPLPDKFGLTPDDRRKVEIHGEVNQDSVSILTSERLNKPGSADVELRGVTTTGRNQIT